MPNQYKNKVVYGDSVLMDITDTTAEAGDVASGAVFYAKNGARTVGTFVQAQSDWAEDDNTDPSYILNKPPIIAGDGEESIVAGKISPSDNETVYTLTINGAAKSDTFTYTTEDTLPSANILKMYCLAYYIISSSNIVYRTITDIDKTNNTITLSSALDSVAAITNGTLTIYAYYHKAIGKYSLAEGQFTYSIGESSHAEGGGTKAIGQSSHSEGMSSTAAGAYSHAEGNGTIANAMSSHSEGSNTIAASNYQHVQGKYNVKDAANTYADIVGNGTSSSARSNAYTLDWSGNGWFAGKVTVGAAPVNNMDVATKQYVDNAIPIVSDEVMIVTITHDDSTNTDSADKTFAEVYSILQNGAVVYVFGADEYFYPCEFYTSNEINFISYTLSYDQFANSYNIWGYRYTLKDDNTVIYTTWYSDIPSASSTTPLSDGTAAVGTSTAYARADHVHPKITQTISMSNNVITLTGSDGSTSSVTLPVYNGGVTGVTGATGGSS